MADANILSNDHDFGNAIAYRPAIAAQKAGVSRATIFNAIRDRELTARTRGRVTLIEAQELLRWVRSMPSRGRAPRAEVAALTKPQIQRTRHHLFRGDTGRAN